MTESDWKKVDEALTIVGGYAQLLIDGYKVSLYLTQVARFKNAIRVYINGEFKGKWLTEDCEERRRFIPCKSRSVITAKDIKKYGIRSKKRAQELKNKYAYNEYSTHWTSFKAMKKHFEKNNQNISIIRLFGDTGQA